MKSKPTDALGRQWRWNPTPREGQGFRIKDEDYDVAEYFARFMPVGLPTWMGHKGTKTVYVSYERRTGQYRRFGFFDVLPWQTARLPTPENRHLLHKNPLINSLSEKMRKELKTRGVFHKNAPQSSSSPKHDAHTNYIYGSFAEMLPPGWKFEWQHQILDRLNRTQTIEFESKGTKYYGNPDATWILTRADGKRLLCFLEHDQNSEPLTSPNRRRTIDQKLAFYKELIATGIYKKLFAFDGGALVLFTTTSQIHSENIVKLIETKFEKPCNFIMTRFSHWFGDKYMEVPHKDIGYAKVYTEPWYRHGHAPYVFFSE